MEFSIYELIVVDGDVREQQTLFIDKAMTGLKRCKAMQHNKSLIGDLKPVVQRPRGPPSLLQNLKRSKAAVETSVVFDEPLSGFEATWLVLGILYMFPKCHACIIDGQAFLKGYQKRYELKFSGVNTVQAKHPVEFVISERQHLLRQ